MLMKPSPCPPYPFSGALLVVQFFLTHFVEVKRWRDIVKPKCQGEAGTFFGLEGAFAGSGETGERG